MPGGQCAEIYPKKPIYDIPSQPEILAGDLVSKLMEQIKPFSPGFTLGEMAQSIDKNSNGEFIITTDKGTQHQAPIVAIAGGLGTFTPRKPQLDRLKEYEDNGVDYIIRDPEKYRDKKVLIAGGGDSALDWTIFLSNIAAEITLIHRRSEFRGAIDSVEKIQFLKNNNKIKLFTPAEVFKLEGKNSLEAIYIMHREQEKKIEIDYFIPLFGLTPKLGPIVDWGLEIEKNAIKVNNSIDYQTNIPGIYAIGDVNIYPGKLKLILCGFHEATLMCQSAYSRIHPKKKNILKYTTVSGINGFDGTRKEAQKSTIRSIE
jgi:thioredoxin reductase (NADPH)